jgi:hypothetical protein
VPDGLHPSLHQSKVESWLYSPSRLVLVTSSLSKMSFSEVKLRNRRPQEPDAGRSDFLRKDDLG